MTQLSSRKLASITHATPLHSAAYNGNYKRVKDLLTRGADINKKIVQGLTPLHLAAFGAHPEVVQLLIKSNANVNAKDDQGKTPLHWANNEKVVEELLKGNANIEARDNFGMTPLHFSSKWPKVKVVKSLIKAGANINARDKYGQTPLHLINEYHERGGLRRSYPPSEYVISQEMGYNLGYVKIKIKKVAETLLKAGANVNIKDSSGRTPLHFSSAEIAVLLIRKNVDITVIDKKGKTALDYAKEWNDRKKEALLN